MINNKKDMKFEGGYCLRRVWNGEIECEYGQIIIYTCSKFSNHKNIFKKNIWQFVLYSIYLKIYRWDSSLYFISAIGK